MDGNLQNLSFGSHRSALVESLIRTVGKDPSDASDADWFRAAAYYVRGQMAERWLATGRLPRARGAKVVYYLSMEFLIGRSLRSHLLNLGLEDGMRAAFASLGVDFARVCDAEPDAALGNGGLGRLAACLLDSLTTLGYPAYGYSIRYDQGVFAQAIDDGWQVERPDNWLAHGNPWEYERPSVTHRIAFGGQIARRGEAAEKASWAPEREIMAKAYDLQVSGYGQDVINTIRLWSARAANEFDLGHFNRGDHVGAHRDRLESEALSRVLYPDDSTEIGRELRLRQEHFFVSASLQDILARFLETGAPLGSLPERIAIQLNDTHPALAVAEMMRLLVDVHDVDWNEAWRICRGVFAYTNHTLLAEALETWPVRLFERLLPRHLDIIYRINDRFLREIAGHAGHDHDLYRRVSLIDETNGRHVRMAHLACVGSHRVNGVSQLHTDIMRAGVFADFERSFPGLIVNKTNGISSRRWLNLANPELSRLISDRIGDAWIVHLEALSAFAAFQADPETQIRFRAAKEAAKRRLAAWVQDRTGTVLDTASLFDVHVKRIHEYKRQLLNVLHVIARYDRIRRGETGDLVPRTVIFAGKAASGYYTAKLIIKLINDVARTIDADPRAEGFLKVVFVPNYGVTAAEFLIPAAELSEQISTAGAEASGTGNMKLALNGALTIGTRDGANIEIGNAVGEDNIFFFGMTADEVRDLCRSGQYQPQAVYDAEPELREALDMVRSGAFSPDDRGRYHSLVDSLLSADRFMVLGDFAAYLSRQGDVDRAYRRTPEDWTRMAIANVAAMGPFSSDRTVREYADEIWRVRPCRLNEPEVGAA